MIRQVIEQAFTSADRAVVEGRDRFKELHLVTTGKDPTR